MSCRLTLQPPMHLYVCRVECGRGRRGYSLSQVCATDMSMARMNHLCSTARLLLMSYLLRMALPWTPPPCRASSSVSQVMTVVQSLYSFANSQPGMAECIRAKQCSLNSINKLLQDIMRCLPGILRL